MPSVSITPPCPTTHTPNMLTVQVAFRQKVEREIRRYGVDMAMKRWHVMCDYLQTEDWWPAVVREVEMVFDKAFDERNLRQIENICRPNPSHIQLTVNQQQGDLGTSNHFEKDSHSQVFNGDVTGQFMK